MRYCSSGSEDGYLTTSDDDDSDEVEAELQREEDVHDGVLEDDGVPDAGRQSLSPLEVRKLNFPIHSPYNILSGCQLKRCAEHRPSARC